MGRWLCFTTITSTSGKTLEELANIKGKPVAFNSEMTLREWRKGHLKL